MSRVSVNSFTLLDQKLEKIIDYTSLNLYKVGEEVWARKDDDYWYPAKIL